MLLYEAPTELCCSVRELKLSGEIGEGDSGLGRILRTYVFKSKMNLQLVRWGIMTVNIVGIWNEIQVNAQKRRV